MCDRHDGLTNDVQIAFQQQVIAAMDGASQSVLQRSDCIIGPSLVYCGEELFERGTGQRVCCRSGSVWEQPVNGLFAEGAALALKGDANMARTFHRTTPST